MAKVRVTIDKEFPSRVYKTSLLFSALIVFLSLLYGHWPTTWGFMIGAGISILFFKILWWTVDQVFKRSGKKALYFSLKIFLIKFPLLGIFLYYLFKNVEINPFALVGGIALVQVIMFLKVIGVVILNSMNKSERLQDSKPSHPKTRGNSLRSIAS
ncbi:MAG: ATP synthase subunit I [Thermodesulfobacteriota bacterium]